MDQCDIQLRAANDTDLESLVRLAVARATDRGCRSVGLTTNERNQAALALYERFGFTAERARWLGGRQLWLERPLDAK